MRIIFTILIFIPTILFAQERYVPAPKVGWDSLKSAMKYPDLLLRAGLRTALSATIRIDSTGKLISISFAPFKGWGNVDNIDYRCPLTKVDSTFCESFDKACRSLEWIPGVENGIKKSMDVTVPFIFIYHPFDDTQSNQKIIIKDVARPKPPERIY